MTRDVPCGTLLLVAPPAAIATSPTPGTQPLPNDLSSLLGLTLRTTGGGHHREEAGSGGEPREVGPMVVPPADAAAAGGTRCRLEGFESGVSFGSLYDGSEVSAATVPHLPDMLIRRSTNPATVNASLRSPVSLERAIELNAYGEPWGDGGYPRVLDTRSLRLKFCLMKTMISHFHVSFDLLLMS